MKKIFFGLAFVVTLSMVIFVGYGSAKEIEYSGGGSSKLHRWINIGEVIEIREENFSIEKKDRGQYTYFVDEKTVFRVSDGENPGFSDLLIGDKVAVLGRFFEDEFRARLVVIIPDGFRLQSWFRIRLRGELVELDGEKKSITVITGAGEEILVFLNEKTRMLGKASEISDMEIGWKVIALGRKLDDGSFHAKIIWAVRYPEWIRQVGIVSEVDEVSSHFIISTRRDEKLYFRIDEETKFFNRKGQAETLPGVGSDMVVIIDARQVNEGEYLAKRVTLADSGVLENFEVRKVGFITQIEPEAFVIENGDGDSVIFQINDETRFRSRGKVVKEIKDIKTGMILLVGGTLGENGENIAELVVVYQAVPDW